MSPKAAFYDDDDMQDEWSEEEEYWDEEEPAQPDGAEQPAEVRREAGAPVMAGPTCITP